MKIEWGDKYKFVESIPGPVPNWALKELAEELKRLKVDVNIHALGLPDVDGWCIHQEDDVWLVYLSERGKRYGPAIFTSEFDAANFYLWRRISHPKSGNSDVGSLPRLRE